MVVTLKEYLESYNSINKLKVVNETNDVIFDSNNDLNDFSYDEVLGLTNQVVEATNDREVIERVIPFAGINGSAFEIKNNFVIKIKVVN